MKTILHREMLLEDQSKICDWRIKHNRYSRQNFIDNEYKWMEHQINWFENLDRKTNHFFSIYESNSDKKEAIGISALTSIDLINLKAEIHHYIGRNYIDPDLSMQSIDILKSYAFDKLNLHSLYVETFEFDELKFNFFKDYGFTHICRWPHKTIKNMNGQIKYIDVNIQVVLNNK